MNECYQGYNLYIFLMVQFNSAKTQPVLALRATTVNYS